MTWVLILLVYAGPFAKGDSVALTSIPGFTSQAECQRAGQAALRLPDGSAKEARVVCVQQGAKP